MTLTLPVLRAWAPSGLGAGGARLATSASTLDDQVQVLTLAADAAVDGWTGPTASAAQLRLGVLGSAGRRTATALVGVADVLTDAATDLAAVRDVVLAAVDDARAAGFLVLDDGSVTAYTVAPGPGQPEMQDHVNTEAAGRAERIGRLLGAAAQADERWADALRTAVEAVAETAQERDPGPTGISPGVQAVLDGRAPLPSDPEGLHDFWSDLTPEEKEALYAADPSIGNRNGIPTVDRDLFNQRHLLDLRADAGDDLDALLAAHPDWAAGDVPPQGRAFGPAHREYVDWQEQVDAARTQVQGYDAVAAGLGDGPVGQPPRYLMGIDAHDRAVIATGNPDTARNVATMVPGTGSTLSKIEGDVGRADAVRQAAARAGDPDAAVITWYGYDAPEGLTDATDEKYAEAGAGDLDAFQAGLRATHDGPPSHNTVLGHSYGTTVVGTAATGENHLAADDVVLVASPGAMADEASDFRLDGESSDTVGEHVWATKAQYDPVPLYATTGDFGRDPTGSGFGGQRFEAASGGAGPWYALGWNQDAHSSYWDRGNPALDNMGRIVAGEPGTVSR